MKIIDLLNKIANGEEVPKIILFNSYKYRFDEIDRVYRNIRGNCTLGTINELDLYLNDEVEILEEEPTQEETKEYANKFLEAWMPVKKQFGKLFDEIARISNVSNVENGLEEEKKIPEKLILHTLSNNDSADFTTLQDFNNRDIQRTINWILEYLKSKGE